MVRCVYREAGTGLAGGEENNKETTTLPDVNKMQELVHRYEKFCIFFAMVFFAATFNIFNALEMIFFILIKFLHYTDCIIGLTPEFMCL